MDVQKLEAFPPPPGVWGSLRAGFDIVAGRAALILVPLALDLLLWLGPRLSVEALLKPFFNLIFEQARRGVATSELDAFARSQSMILAWLHDFNLMSLLSKLQFFPIGIPSLSALTLPVETPLGTRSVIEISSVWSLVGLSFVLVLIGWVGGGLYFRLVSGTILGGNEAGISSTRAVVQSLFLSFVWAMALMFILLPVTFVVGILGFISPVLASAAVLAVAFFSFFLIVPLFFMPHGIFVRRQNALYSIYSGLRMSRFTLPTSGLFVLTFFLLSRGLDYLWSVPKNDSWLTLVGFAGHAFIATALLASSFVYYRDMNDWLQNFFQRFQAAGKPSSTGQV
jgi:hypothetical protein